MSYKAPAHNALSPYLHSNHPERVVAFVAAVCEGKETFRALRPDGSVQHLELTIDDSVLMLGQKQIDPGSNSMTLHVYVRNCDAAYAKALELGCASIMSPQQRPAGDRIAGVKDPDGNTWWLATHQSE
jgi:uncharacterized glyoxalase superfamily protein PhnB